MDHPAAIEIFTNEKFKVAAVPRVPPVRRRAAHLPVAAATVAAATCSPTLLRRDRIYAGGFRHDYAGVAEMHSLDARFRRRRRAATTGPC